MTKKQIERQDFVDSMIYTLLNTLSPKLLLNWNIAMIGNVRDAIEKEFSKIGIKSEEFYP